MYLQTAVLFCHAWTFVILPGHPASEPLFHVFGMPFLSLISIPEAEAGSHCVNWRCQTLDFSAFL